MALRALVWLKRDLRSADHAPLAAAATHCMAAAIYVVEPEWLASPECDAQHLAFAQAHVSALRETLLARGMPLLVRYGNVIDVFTTLRREFAFDVLLSHEETGPGWTFRRDKAVARWCSHMGVQWREWPQNGVVRRLRDRNGWAARWQRHMDAPIVPVPAHWPSSPDLELGEWPAAQVERMALGKARALPAAGEASAHRVLHSFLHARGARYLETLSSPLTAPSGCSRLSSYLAFGVISLRKVYQETDQRIEALTSQGDPDARRFARHLHGFVGRLHWHCHFIQKLESQPSIEWTNVSRSYDGLREDHVDVSRFDAWKSGYTGYPMVDACMRSLNATGWLNFRMRAMLVSFAAHHLWLHWREPGLHLARQFLDFEPGIHWCQMQMQSGTTGINAFRVYSPTKQQADHDPRSEFIRQWIPELGTPRYPRPIVDERLAMRVARQRLLAVRQSAGAREEAREVQRRHGSRKRQAPSGRPWPASRQPVQPDLF